jgi:hypothetical protein
MRALLHACMLVLVLLTARASVQLFTLLMYLFIFGSITLLFPIRLLLASSPLQKNAGSQSFGRDCSLCASLKCTCDPSTTLEFGKSSASWRCAPSSLRVRFVCAYFSMCALL